MLILSLRGDGFIKILGISAIAEFRAAVACSRRSVSAFAFKCNEILAVGAFTEVAWFAGLILSAIDSKHGPFDQGAMRSDLSADRRLILSQCVCYSSLGRIVAYSYLNDLAFFQSQMLITVAD
jgi:hypothetical protein